MDKQSNHSILKDDEIVYDFIFLGIGASNSLILLSLINNGVLKNKRVAIIEPALKNINDKTYCFWALPSEQIVKDLKPIISHSYNSIDLNQTCPQAIENQPYCVIKSIDLYNFINKKILQFKIPIFREKANSIVSSKDFNSVFTDKSTIKAKYIFDSRTPSFPEISAKDIYINQSFYGFYIKTEKDAFDKNCFEMMDFDVEQAGFTQFVYTLPTSKNESLIELTRFGSEKINIDYAKKILHENIQFKYGNYELIDVETGNIPMTTHQFAKSDNKFVLNTGIAANLIKPSTGYGFKNMFEFAKIVSEKISDENLENFNEISLNHKTRFRFYDSLLLIILLRWPQFGKNIFTQLYRNQNITTIFSFLEEKTSIFQEVKIFASLPIFIFLKSLSVYVVAQRLVRYISLFFLLVGYFVLSFINKEIALYFGYFCSIIGLFSIGIPHGAIDHLILKHKDNSLILFIAKYLIAVVCFFIFWKFYPAIALLIFIAYSSFHFGESEFEEMGQSINSVQTYLRSFLLGFSTLMFLIFSHLKESISVISQINGINFNPEFEIILGKIQLFLVFISILYVTAEAIVKKKLSLIILALILIISTQLPLFLGFVLYFVSQHSSNAWQHLKNKLKSSSLKLYQKALPFTLGALLLFILFFANHLFNLRNIDFLVSDFFVFLACLSLPHFVSMHLFYKS